MALGKRVARTIGYLALIVMAGGVSAGVLTQDSRLFLVALVALLVAAIAALNYFAANLPHDFNQEDRWP